MGSSRSWTDGSFVRPLPKAELRVGARISTDADVSVNISAFHLSHGDLSASVSEASWLAGLSPRHMCLEVTETAVMAEPATASAALKRITDDGFSVALDDFGTGYSSLAYLRTLPVSRLKIDRCAAVQGSVGPFVVVVVGEGIELVLQAVQVAGRRSCAEPALEGLVQALDAPMFVKRPVLAAVVLAAAGSRIPLGRGSA